jgi:hypothetical protein
MIGAAALAEENATDMAPLCEWRDNIHPNAPAITSTAKPASHDLRETFWRHRWL